MRKRVHGQLSPTREQYQQKETNMRGTRRVMVTGTGAVTPIGNDVESFWAAVKQGRSGVAPLADHDGGLNLPSDLHIKIAAQVKDFDAKARLQNRKLQGADRYAQFAGAAAAEAFAQSKLELPLAVDAVRAGTNAAEHSAQQDARRIG